MMTADPIRVLIVDDHAMVRRGLAAFLQAYDDLELVGEAGSGAEAVKRCAQEGPDVVLMDLVLPGIDGVVATRVIRQRHPQLQVIALTSFHEEDLVPRAAGRRHRLPAQNRHRRRVGECHPRGGRGLRLLNILNCFPRAAPLRCAVLLLG